MFIEVEIAHLAGRKFRDARDHAAVVLVVDGADFTARTVA